VLSVFDFVPPSSGQSEVKDKELEEKVSAEFHSRHFYGAIIAATAF